MSTPFTHKTAIRQPATVETWTLRAGVRAGMANGGLALAARYAP